MGNTEFWGIAAPVRSLGSHCQWKSQDCPLEEGPQSQGELHQGSYEGQVWLQGGHSGSKGKGCSELKESEAAYSETLSENMAAKSLHCATLCREHARHMQELEEWALDVENKSHQDFLFAHQAMLHHASQSLKENLLSSYHILLGQPSSSLQSIPSAKAPKAEGQPPATTSPRPEPNWSPWLKRWHSLTDIQGDTSTDKISPMALQEEPLSSKRGKMADWSSSLKPSHTDVFGWGLWSCERGQSMLLCHSPLELGSWQFGRPLWHFLGNLPKALACWESLFTKYNYHGMDWMNWNMQTMFSFVPTQGVKVPKGSVHQGISKNHGLKRDSWLWHPPAFCWLYFLPLVWQRWTEWGDHHQPPKDSTL